ncbi:MAG: TetR/AcrR family transcriptional regulator [Actinomycetota bacterium]|nr:TetR/AcrR family transcriptional regulator [Actinomycetota bacterium]
MSRWEPDSRSRLQAAAFDLFVRYGYEKVTIAEIAEAARLTKRSFFNHFPDKREILFAGSKDFESSVVDNLRQMDLGGAPLRSVLDALALASEQLAKFRDFALQRRNLILSSPELREREHMKNESLIGALGSELGGRDIPATSAMLTAQVGVMIFNLAYERYTEDNGLDLKAEMDRCLLEVRAVVDYVTLTPGSTE